MVKRMKNGSTHAYLQMRVTLYLLHYCPPCLPKEDECYVLVDSFEISTMGKTCDNNYAPVIYDNPLFVPNFDMHGTKEFCLENVYDKYLDDGPILNDQSSCYRIVKSGFEGFNPTIFELDKIMFL